MWAALIAGLIVGAALTALIIFASIVYHMSDFWG